MSPHLPPSLLQLLRPASTAESSDKPTNDRHFVTWTEEEDEILRHAIQLHGTEKWSVIAAQFHGKTSRQCRRRWYTYLSTTCKKGGWSPDEDQLLLEAHSKYGNRWTEIAKVVPGRTDNAVKNRFCALCKKQARETDITSSQSSGDVSTDECRTNQKRRVLEQNNNIVNKKSRGDLVQQPRPQVAVLQQRTHHIEIKGTQAWIADESLAHRAHPVRREPIIQGGKVSKMLSSKSQKDVQSLKVMRLKGFSTPAHETPADKPVVPQGPCTFQAPNSFSDNLSPEIAALTQGAELLDSLVERRDARMRLLGGSDDTWKAFDWFTIDGSKAPQRHTLAPNSLLPLSHFESPYLGKENYVHFSTFSGESRLGSSLPLLRDDVEIKHQQGYGYGTTEVKSEKILKHKAKFENENCSSLSSPADASQIRTWKSPLSSNHGAACDTGVQGTAAELDKTKEEESPLPNSSFSDMPSPIRFAPRSQFLIDGMPSPQFSDSEKQFLLSALDSGYQLPLMDSPLLSNSGSPFCRTSLTDRLKGSLEISYDLGSSSHNSS